MPNNRILTLAFILLVAPPFLVAAWMNQKKLAELRAIPAYNFAGKGDHVPFASLWRLHLDDALG